MDIVAARVALRRMASNAIVERLREQFPSLDFYVSVRSGSMSLDRVVVPKADRGSGLGSAFMKALTAEADRLRLVITLSPSTDFGGSSVARLEAFYKRFGFVKNKGRHKDFAISDAMYRLPR
jgi:predicted GNAT family N-acyltransferase